MRVPLIVLCSILASCASPEELARRQAAQAEYQRQQEIAYTNHLRGQCEAIGYQRDSDPWRQCILQLHAQNQAHRSQMQGIILNNAIQQQYQSLPPCYQLAPGARGFAQAQGRCR